MERNAEIESLSFRKEYLPAHLPGSPIVEPPPRLARVDHVSVENDREESHGYSSPLVLEPQERHTVLESESPPIDSSSTPYFPTSPVIEPQSTLQEVDLDYVSVDEPIEESQECSSPLVLEPQERYTGLGPELPPVDSNSPPYFPNSPMTEPLSPIQQVYDNHISADTYAEENWSYSSPVVFEPQERYEVLEVESPLIEPHPTPDWPNSPNTELPPSQLTDIDYISVNDSTEEYQSRTPQHKSVPQRLPMEGNSRSDSFFG